MFGREWMTVITFELTRMASSARLSAAWGSPPSLFDRFQVRTPVAPLSNGRYVNVSPSDKTLVKDYSVLGEFSQSIREIFVVNVYIFLVNVPLDLILHYSSF